MRLLSICCLFLNLLIVHGLKDSVCGQLICLNATYIAGSLTYEMQVNDPVGWVGLGFGQQMPNTHMVILWSNEDGTVTLSQRYAVGHIEPKSENTPPWPATLVKPLTVQSAGKLALAFKIPVNESYFNTRFSEHSIIWAYSRNRPSSGNPMASLNYHDARGVFSLNLKPHKGSSPSPKEVPLNRYERLIVLHALFVSFGFLVLLPGGGIVARYARTFTTEWIRVHQICNMFIAPPVLTLGLCSALLAIHMNEGLHLNDVHQLCGTILLTMYSLQVGLGIHIHRARFSKTSTHPMRNVTHVILGLFIIGGAIFQVKGGLYEWAAKTGRPEPRKWFIAWKAWSLILPLVYMGGLVLLQRQFRQEREVAQSGRQYISLSDGVEVNQSVFSAEGDGLVERDAV
ncbi:hypothetical protein AX15_000967 [Amanita polypyramis BW_CC]|nr:hypothetical protein AX15_000967 [Amanita polypyramis BW_CC]